MSWSLFKPDIDERVRQWPCTFPWYMCYSGSAANLEASHWCGCLKLYNFMFPIYALAAGGGGGGCVNFIVITHITTISRIAIPACYPALCITSKVALCGQWHVHTVTKTASAAVLMNSPTRRLWLNLNPLNLVRWIDSCHGRSKKTWKPGWNDSTAGLWISSESLHHDTEPRAKVVLEGVAIFFFTFVRTEYGTMGTDSMPFDYFAWFQKIQPKDTHSMNLLHF